jgi:REP element-mobilizing transposase RayT
MPRPYRIQEPELTYHIVSQCIEWRDMMSEDHFKECFLEVLRRSKEKYDYKLISFCIMPNHIHLIIHTTQSGAPISRIVQYIKARFAEIYNKTLKRTGPFWNGRYKDIIVQFAKDAVHYLLWLLWYLAFNPVRKRICTNPLKYCYSSIRAYLEEHVDVGVPIDYHDFFLQLGNTFKERVKQFIRYEEIYLKRYSIFEWA